MAACGINTIQDGSSAILRAECGWTVQLSTEPLDTDLSISVLETTPEFAVYTTHICRNKL